MSAVDASIDRKLPKTAAEREALIRRCSIGALDFRFTQEEIEALVRGLVPDPDPIDAETMHAIEAFRSKRKGLRGKDEKWVTVDSRIVNERPPPVMCLEKLREAHIEVGAAVALDARVIHRREIVKRARDRFEARMRALTPPLRFALRVAAFVKSLRATLRRAWEMTGTIDGIIVRPAQKAPTKYTPRVVTR